MRKWMIMAIVAGMMAACGKSLPSEYSESESMPDIYPDYRDVTIPVNIAPLTFEADIPVEDMAVQFLAGDEEVVCNGRKAQPGIEEWRRLTERACGGAIDVTVMMKNGGQWTRYKPFHIYVSADSIDPYISYRLIAPSYVVYEELTIKQRCLENYDESVIYDNMLCSKAGAGQCINCHSYQQYNPDRMQFHARENNGGTVIAYDGQLMKVNMKNDKLLSAGVYPAWHPWLKLIAYSTNKTHQVFHCNDSNKIEVFDDASDLILYDVERNEVADIEREPDEWEVFPFWSPDGKALYYCSAHFVIPDSVVSRPDTVIAHAQEVRYNLYRKDFDPQTLQFGPRQLVFNADSLGMSATFPRVSPDGRFLMFTLGRFGVFHIWHHDADLWLLDLQTGEVRNVEEINSADTESYHSWSSNGRWVVFSSRRDDGNFTRPFIAHIDSLGRGSKPFELPSHDPEYHRLLMKSYNIPELMKGPVTIRPQQFADILKGEGKPPVKWVKR